MSITTQKIMRFSCCLRKLLKKIKKSIIPPNGRKYISKFLIILPKTMFPSYRVVVNPVIIETNRKTLNYLGGDSLNRSFSTEFYDSLTSSEEGSTTIKRSSKSSQKSKKTSSKTNNCCKHCKKLFYNEDNQTTLPYSPNSSSGTHQKSFEEFKNRNLLQISTPKLSNGSANTDPKLDIKEKSIKRQCYSTPTKLWSDEVEQELKESKAKHENDEKSPLSSSKSCVNEKEMEFMSKTPLRRITVGDIQSVKLKPPNMTLNIPKTPEVHDMMAVLRKRFAAMHSPMFDDVTMISSDSGGDISDFYDDFSNIALRKRPNMAIGVM